MVKRIILGGWGKKLTTSCLVWATYQNSDSKIKYKKYVCPRLNSSTIPIGMHTKQNKQTKTQPKHPKIRNNNSIRFSKKKKSWIICLSFLPNFYTSFPFCWHLCITSIHVFWVSSLCQVSCLALAPRKLGKIPSVGGGRIFF